MSDIYQIFVPEYVPMENKGEEAIIRGMCDVIFPDGNAEFHVLDTQITEPYSRDGLHIYPARWFYSPWRGQEFRLGFAPRELYASACSVLRHLLNRLAPRWVTIPQGPVRRLARLLPRLRTVAPSGDPYRDSMSRLLACDYLIAGHDGAFNEYDCHVIDMMRSLGMHFGIFGTSMKVKERSPIIKGIFQRTLAKAEFIYCRNEVGYNWARANFPDLAIELAPDPAFGMRPSSDEQVDAIIAQEELGDFFRKPVVMLTPAEPAPIARNCFQGQGSREARLTLHHALLARLVEYLVAQYDVNVLFLPHTIGPTPDLDDREIAHSVVRKLTRGHDHVRVMTSDYSARDLKGLIRRAALLIGERIHSLIGAVGVQTPFVCLGVQQDNRVRGIIGTMCRMESAIYFLNTPVEADILAHVDRAWVARDAQRASLAVIDSELRARLAVVGQQMRQRIDATRGDGHD